MVNGELVWACNLCSDTLDIEEEMIIHMQESHRRVEMVSSGKDGHCTV